MDVEVRLDRLAEPIVASVADDAHNPNPGIAFRNSQLKGRLAFQFGNTELTANRVPIWEIALCHVFADDCNPISATGLRLIEEPSLQQRNVEHRKVFRTNEVQRRALLVG